VRIRKIPRLCTRRRGRCAIFRGCRYFQRTRVPAADCSSQRRRQNLDAHRAPFGPDGALGRIGLAHGEGGRGTCCRRCPPNSGAGITRVAEIARLYRSDDGGASWVLASQESAAKTTTQQPTSITGNRDRVYAMGQSVRRSEDAGKSWAIVKGAPRR